MLYFPFLSVDICINTFALALEYLPQFSTFRYRLIYIIYDLFARIIVWKLAFKGEFFINSSYFELIFATENSSWLKITVLISEKS